MKRRKGRRPLANFENLPVTTQVYELSAEERACPCCGVERKEIGAEESWQIEYIPGRFERIQHVRKKYACAKCEGAGEAPRIEVAARAEAAIEKGLAGPGLLAYIVTSKFADYLPLYRLEDIFARQGFEISRATQSVWCGDVADLVEPLYERMAARVRASHVVATDDTTLPMLSPGKTQAGADVGVCGRPGKSLQRVRLHLGPGPRRTETVSEGLHGDFAGRCLRRLQRGGGRQRHHPRGVLGACETEVCGGGENGAGDRARGG